MAEEAVYLSSKMSDMVLTVRFYFQNIHAVYQNLRRLKNDILVGNTINWRLLYVVIAQMKFSSYNLPYCMKLLIEITNVFVKYNCKDVCVILDVIKLIFVASSINQLDYIRSTASVIGRRVSTYGKFIKINDAYRNHYLKGHKDILTAASHANVAAMKLMLKFGMVPFRPLDYDAGYSDFRRVIEKIGIPRLHVEDDSISMPGERMWLIVTSLDFVIRMKSATEDTGNYVECYKLFFDSMEVPYVSCAEMRTFLQTLYSESYNEAIFRIVGDFKRLLPCVPEVSEPRSLKHLSRVQIRENLRQNSNLPNGVSSLRLPSELKKYILLNDDSVYPIPMSTMPPYVERKPHSNLCIPYNEDNILEYIRNM